MSKKHACKSAFSFQVGDTYTPISEVNHLRIGAVTEGEEWQGIRIETGEADCWNGEDLMVAGHFVSLNIDPHPLHTSVRDESTGHWIPCIRPTGGLRIHPEGSPFSLRYSGNKIVWAGAIVDGNFLDLVMGGHFELTSELCLVDPTLEQLFRAMLTRLVTPGTNKAVTQSIVRSFVLALGTQYGVRGGELPLRFSLDERKLRPIFEWIEDHLDERITVADIASVSGVSAVHFSREFKKATGRTPWDYVVQARLERARNLLLEGESIIETALRCGFFDQAHLSRLFKQRFSYSPAAFMRSKMRPVGEPGVQSY